MLRIKANPLAGVVRFHRRLAFGLTVMAFFSGSIAGRAALLWSDLGETQVHETGEGRDILGGLLRRDDSSSDTLYFKFHVDPLSDATMELYFAAFQLFEGNHERLAVGNALNAWAYSAFATGQTGSSNQMVEYFDLNSSNPEPSGIGTFHPYELPHSHLERTIVFKVQYVAGGDDLVTVWLDPDLRPGATEAGQWESLTTKFKANASFDQIHLRHGGGGDGWIFSEMAIATSFNDFVHETGSGAGGETSFTFRSWQREQGLPENYIRALAQTRDGYIWVGTEEGVSRFDGVNFFSLGPQEGFQGGSIQVLFGDSHGALWIGSANSGLSSWLGGKLRKFNMQDGLPSDSITALAEDQQGRLWVGTRAGLVVLQDGHSIQLKGSESFSGKPVTTLFCDHRGRMWVGATGAGIFSFQDDHFTPLREAALDNVLQDPHCVLVDRQERIWIGAGDDFVLCRDGTGWQRFGVPRHLATHHISTLVQEPDGTIWAGSVGEGLFEFKAGKLVVANASSGLSDNLVEALLMDQEGKLWVGTHGGLNRICPRKVSVLSHNVGLDYGVVQGLAETGRELIWAAQPNGVYQWDGQIFRRLMLSGLPSQEPCVNALLAARDGSCWVAGPGGLLHFKNPKSAEESGGSPALSSLNITALGEDAKGAIWAGTREGELWYLAGEKWQQQTNGPHDQAITAIAPDLDGSLWIGTQGDGLHRLQGATALQGRKLHGLPSDWIRALYLDPDRTLWIGTAGGGLSRLKGDRIDVFTTREGLPDDTISQILEDGAGNLWLGGNRGIARVSKHDLEELAAHHIRAVYPQVFGRTDGMLSEECTSGFFPAGLRTQTGALWFATLKGIVRVDPQYAVNSPSPAVVLETILVDGVPGLSSSTSSDNNPESRRKSQALRLAPGRHTLEFRYTGLSFDAPERVRFRYRLKGLDSDWFEAGTRRVAFYNFVPPGSYLFEVIACNGDGIWNRQGASLPLTVLPHFWQNWWFIWGGLLVTGIAGVGGIRLVEKRRMRQRLKRLEQERLLERERTRIAQDLHDTMGAKLCRISFLSEHAQRSEAVAGEVRDQIASISDDSRDVLRSLDEIVWAVNPQMDTLDHLVSYISQYAREYFRKTGVECDLEIPVQLPVQPLTSQTRHHVFLAVHEALTNILKHSQATRARIVMVCHEHSFEIVVSDNGQGFDPVSNGAHSSESGTGFRNGLENMRRRLAELGGQFEVTSRSGEGTIVRFVLFFNQPTHPT
jgi:ligand-binding sensor domain-containing protein/signal transduction histidine kinase